VSPDALSRFLQSFDSLPNDAVVPDAVASAVLNISQRALDRNSPVPAVHITARRKGRRVGDLRNLARGIIVETAPKASNKRTAKVTPNEAAYFKRESQQKGHFHRAFYKSTALY
jgi:hypothetical protein